MESIQSLAVMKILFVLYKEDRYTVDISKKTGVSLRQVNNVLPKMVSDGMIESYMVENKKFYRISGNGKEIVDSISEYIR